MEVNVEKVVEVMEREFTYPLTAQQEAGFKTMLAENVFLAVTSTDEDTVNDSKLIAEAINIILDKNQKPNSKRVDAMEWWNKMSSAEKQKICDLNTEVVGKCRRWETLTGREIESFYTNGCFVPNSKN